ncbi:MAG: hypothetical protein WC796_06035 [Candidatus Pacearchaeota archaeon]
MITEEDIRLEIKERLARIPDDRIEKGEHYYFSNFHLNLPGETRRVTLRDYLDDPQFTRNGRTPRGFFADIDTALQETNVDMEKLTGLMQRYQELEVREEIFKLVFPAFVRLRQMGYSMDDLTG